MTRMTPTGQESSIAGASCGPSRVDFLDLNRSSQMATSEITAEKLSPLLRIWKCCNGRVYARTGETLEVVLAHRLDRRV